MPRKLSGAYAYLPGLYVISPEGTEGIYKIGLSTNLQRRLASYAICFPIGYRIAMIMSLPPINAEGWDDTAEDDVITRALRVLETDIGEELQKYRITTHHKRQEWFRASLQRVRRAFIEAAYERGLAAHVRFHDDFRGALYGDAEAALKSRGGPDDSTTDALGGPNIREELTTKELARYGEPAHTETAEAMGLRRTRGEQVYVVERIVSERTEGGERQYRVKWAGYGSQYNTWEPAAELESTAAEKVAVFKAQQRGSGKGVKRGIDDLPTAAERARERRRNALLRQAAALELMQDSVEQDAEDMVELTRQLDEARAELRELDDNPALTDEQELEALDAFAAQMPPLVVDMQESDEEMDEALD